jgi:hypothetical protein
MLYRVALSVATPAARRWGGLLFLLVLLGASRARAQPSTGGPAPAPAAAVPLDGGATLALAAGAAYGLRRLRRATR